MQHLSNPPALYNVATGTGVSVREFVDACRKVTGQNITVVEQAEARPGDYAEVRASRHIVQAGLAASRHKQRGGRGAWLGSSRHLLTRTDVG